MRFLVFVFAITILFTGCGPSVNQSGMTSPSTSRMEISDGPLQSYAGDIYIIKDSKTEKEFMLVDGPESVAICPMN